MSQKELPVNEGGNEIPGEPPAEPMVSATEDAGAPAPPDLLAEWQAKAAENYDRYLRTAADFDNYRKRAGRERSEAVEFANQSLLNRLLPVLDNLEAALTAADDPKATVASIRTGVGMIGGQLRQVLADAGLEEVDAGGQAFDPNLHEAVSQMESADVPEGQVLHQLRKGYRLRGRLLRPATVVVAKAATEG